MPLRLDNARALPTCPQQSNSRRRRPSSRASRLTPRLHRCQKPSSQNASRPGRHQIGMVGEIISESWARSNRYTRARSSESAHGFTPALGVGIVACVILAVALFALYKEHLVGAWRWSYVITAVVSLYLNVFVLVVQSFVKVSALNALAPTQTEPPFAVTQAAVLA